MVKDVEVFRAHINLDQLRQIEAARRDYVIEGVMIGGLALVAWPAEYRVTGVQTFIVSCNGIVYQKDVGPDSDKIAAGMKRYNPGETWRRTDDEW